MIYIQSRDMVITPYFGHDFHESEVEVQGAAQIKEPYCDILLNLMDKPENMKCSYGSSTIAV